MSVGDLITAVLMPVGAGFSALGALGLVRFPDILTRLHAATKPHTIGLLLVLFGAMPQMNRLADVAPLVLVSLFQLVTAPVVGQTVGTIAYRTGAVDRDVLVVDESDRRP
ncbi:monovalent cation/H(+) antiporter subunit G [Thermomonospora umbrina]|uniref:Multisubunit sodium/proton antiporter MrpG subunit n=1 Tax=Thermomonospora umbrina TaxID=111806 RepID=A0A3D9SP63_9ACTN|nr:monovalent cation/H(+) antiporter subunit G [Thermomonospora umbrina]REE97752.1 multisubunit sodium/proton antiporter MrpG subunit [Thermomonospora umbrina]